MKRTYEVSQGLAPDKKVETQNELKLGYLNLSEGWFEQAKTNFLLTLEYDPNCADAYWGLMLVKFQLSSEDELYSDPVKYKSAIYLDECKKALELASDDLRNKYNSLLERIYTINDGDNY